MIGKTSIGDVQVTDWECENPYTYHGPYASGELRAKALAASRDCATQEVARQLPSSG
jgi:hypothetical protein